MSSRSCSTSNSRLSLLLVYFSSAYLVRQACMHNIPPRHKHLRCLVLLVSDSNYNYTSIHKLFILIKIIMLQTSLFGLSVIITGIWAQVRYYTPALWYTVTLCLIQGPVHDVLSHHNSSQHLCDHNISPGHHRGCAHDHCQHRNCDFYQI